MGFKRPHKAVELYFRNFVFGVEDSLVSTVGLLSGVAIAGVGRGTVFLTGIVLIFVEAFSMAAGSFLSESSAEEYASRAAAPLARPTIASIIMFCSYFVSGFIPLFPYALWNTDIALITSVGLSLVSLFALGVFNAYVSDRGLLRRGLRTLFIGGAAILVGILAGTIADIFATTVI